MVIPLVPEPGAVIRLPIAGFEARDDHAFPGRRAAVVYLQGCPLQCGYCETASSMGPARRAAPGEWPAMEALLPRLDWVALDTKGRGADFDRIGGRHGIWQHHARSLSLLLESDVPFECRTTLHWRDFTLEELERLAMTLADCGVRRYAIQLARREHCLDPGYREAVEDAPPRQALETLARRLKRHFEHLELRG